ncbi:MAG: hypothetical protein IMX02_00075 [Limnochordaceae bacterium]|nr:hypothetical protein [Limnochordaceae bacterium]
MGASAMHDVTEGGLLGAVWEMAQASGCGVEIWEAAVPVREETRQVCRRFGIDPLRLISSGAMLAAAPDARGGGAGAARRGPGGRRDRAGASGGGGCPRRAGKRRGATHHRSARRRPVAGAVELSQTPKGGRRPPGEACYTGPEVRWSAGSHAKTGAGSHA